MENILINSGQFFQVSDIEVVHLSALLGDRHIHLQHETRGLLLPEDEEGLEVRQGGHDRPLELEVMWVNWICHLDPFGLVTWTQKTFNTCHATCASHLLYLWSPFHFQNSKSSISWLQLATSSGLHWISCL